VAARVFGRAQARKLEHLLGAYLWQDSGERRVFRAKGAVYTTSGLACAGAELELQAEGD
jgi:hypothetical protein